MEWIAFNWVNVALVFFNGYIAITCFQRGSNFAGHINMLAVVINGIVIALKVTA